MLKIILIIIGIIIGIVGMLIGNYLLAFAGVGLVRWMVDLLKEDVEDEDW